jgi:hypothetical protein
MSRILLAFQDLSLSIGILGLMQHGGAECTAAEFYIKSVWILAEEE